MKIVVRLDIRTEPITDLCMNAYTMNPDEYYMSHCMLYAQNKAYNVR